MNHFIITYDVIIDTNSPIEGTTGNVVFGARHSRDYKPLQVAQYIKEEYGLQYPRAREIRVRIQTAELVDEEVYDRACDGFTLSQKLSRVN